MRRLSAWLLAPACLWTLACFLLPMGLMLAVSFASRGPYGGVEWTFTLGNYTELLDPLYWRIYGRSLLLAGATTALCALLGFPLAYAIAASPPPQQRLWLFLLLIPFWTNFLVRTYAWMFILRTDGILGSMLTMLGLSPTAFEVLYSDTAVLIGLVYGYLPFMVLPLYVALERMDPAWLEAGYDLYASDWAVFRRIVVPSARPGLIAGSVLVFIPSLGAYITPDLLGGARSMMLGNLIQHEYLVIRDWPLGSAASLVLMAGVLVGAAILFRNESQLSGARQRDEAASPPASPDVTGQTERGAA
ncbi:MAG: ABC transporter permease [Nitrospirae bacterium]|nr:ABC transporter permease [Nitrospirota bacterium]